ncbi:MAG: hypothetical protein CMM02_06340 [Rhodopirellula sp.]|nr:hypothetical protein [Rhodopirellula sp.]
MSFLKTKDYKNILVTGGSKFLGYTISNYLKNNDLKFDAVSTLDCDLKDNNEVYKLFKNNYDLIIHCAAVQGGLGFISTEQTKVFLDNIKIHSNIIEQCINKPPRMFIGIGSSCMYPGNKENMMEADIWNGKMSESVLTYGFTKKLLMLGQSCLFKEYNISGSHVILNNLYGPHDNFDEQSAHVIADLIRKFREAKKLNNPVNVWGDGSAKREFLYIDDAVTGIFKTIETINEFDVINICSGKTNSIMEIVNILSKIFDYSNINFDISKPTGAKIKGLNPEKMISLLKWKPIVDIESGLRKTVEWYQEKY